VREKKILTKRIGRYNPLDLNAYKKLDGLKALKKALAMTPKSVIEQIRQSDLTGRGGAEFPTGLKWALTAQQKSANGGPKYFICNADEGELGTFKDKVLLDGDPWAIIEGILIATYAIGAKQSYIYIKGEYKKTIKLWEKLTNQAKKAGLLGEKILGWNFSTNLQVVSGKGPYIAGEEFALISSLELRRAMSRLKPPYPSQRGLFGKPTVVNNVETIANIPVIIADGVEKYRKLGTEGEHGTRLFSLSGDVKQKGVFELEMGSGTLLQFINEFGKGTTKGKAIKAVQPGGGTSAFITRDSVDCTLTSKAIRQAGSSIGTAVVIVYEQGRNAVDIVRDLMQFYGVESCGRCAPCRIGSVRMKEIIDNLAHGNGTAQDLTQLHEIAKACIAASTCGMGQAFPLPVISALKLFPEDFEQAIRKAAGGGIKIYL
jgi:NADH:ubiquinone oxidoreductase subunit F (NADH-binding)